REGVAEAGGGTRAELDELAARDDGGQPVPVLHEQRLVHPQVVPDEIQGLRTADLAAERAGGIAGDGVEEIERDGTDDHQDHERAEDSADEKAGHGVVSAPAGGLSGAAAPVPGGTETVTG